jgi:starch synthase
MIERGGNKLRVAILEKFPIALIDQLGERPRSEWRTSEDELKRGTSLTVEGYLVGALATSPELDVHVVTFEKGIQQSEVMNLSLPATLHRLPARRGTGMPSGWIPRARACRKYLREVIGPHVVHGVRTDYGHATMAVLSGFPHVITIEGFIESTPRPAMFEPLFFVGSRIERWTIRNARNVIAVSRHVEDRIGPRTAGRIFRVPNMVHTSFFEGAKDTTPSTVVFVGRISPEKGLMDFLRAAAISERNGVRVEWVVVGSPSGHQGDGYFNDCRAFADSQLKGPARFLGWVPNSALPGIFRDAVCAVFPYQAPYETFAISVGEAMATATPPVVYDYGPLPEHVDDGRSGIVVPAGDIPALANAIGSLARDRALSKSFGEAARLRAQAYRQDVVASDLIKIYRKVSGRK